MKNNLTHTRTMLFEKLHALLTEGSTATIVVAKTADGNLTVSASVNNAKTSDPGKAYIQPFIVSGTPAELDAGFADIIAEPLGRSAGLQTSMAEFEASQKVAKEKSAAAQAEKNKADKEKKDRKATYDKLVAKAAELEKDRKYKEAADTYTKAAGFADGADKSKAEKKAKDLRAKDVPMLDFFGSGSDDSEGNNEETAPEETEETEEPEGTEEPDFNENGEE